MKRLTTYISHVKELHSLNEYLNEKLIVDKNYKQVYTYAPKSFDDLRKIIKQRYEEQGPGTEQNPINFNDIDVSNIDSFCKIDNGTGIFEGTRFEYIDLSNWNVSGVKSMEALFYECYNLKSVGDLSGWDVSSVRHMGYMFDGCYQLKSVGNLSNWDVSNVEGMYLMFYNCEKLKSVGDLSNWDISNVKDMDRMFKNSGITNIPGWYTG